MNNFSIYIFAIQSNIDIVKLSLNECLNSAARIINIVTPFKDSEVFKDYLSSLPKITNSRIKIICDEDLDLNKNFLKKIQNLNIALQKKGRSSGWYYQQYLKLKVVQAATEISFIIDGDTIVFSDYINNSFNSRIISQTSESVEVYENLIDRIAIRRLQQRSKSFIANMIIFEPGLFSSNFNLESEFLRWLDICISEELCDISEYQIIGNLMVCKYGWKVKPIKLFRRGDLLIKNETTEKSLLKFRDFYHAVSFERHHRRSILKTVAAFVLLKIRYAW